MSLNDAPSANRVHIAFFGRTNAGKSSVVNAVTGQPISVVSPVKGTTTDPVYKAMELLPLGPVLIIDTPGFDDNGELGPLRMQKTRQVLHKTDIAVLVADAQHGLSPCDHELTELFRTQSIPYIIVYNKCDLLSSLPPSDSHALYVSAQQDQTIHELKERLAALATPGEAHPLIGDLLNPGDVAILITPIDSAAPKGRLILPQQQVIRDILDHRGIALVLQETELKQILSTLSVPPKLVITDSQVFGKAAKILPHDVPLTSFSILMARYKGLLANAVQGARVLDTLHTGDKILICEGCTHHRQCDDIGTVKLPGWIRQYTHAEPEFSFTSGIDFPDDLSDYRLIIHCGGCMLNERELKYRQSCAVSQNIPMTNYGISIAHIHGILARSIAMFPELHA